MTAAAGITMILRSKPPASGILPVFPGFCRMAISERSGGALKQLVDLDDQKAQLGRFGEIGIGPGFGGAVVVQLLSQSGKNNDRDRFQVLIEFDHP